MHTDIQKLEGEELEKLYKVPFLIWANYDIKEENVKRTSNNYLSTYLAEVAGIKKTGYLEYLTKLRKKFRQLMLSDIGIKMESFTRWMIKNLHIMN